MTEKFSRTLEVKDGKVQCTESRTEEVEKCRFCLHSTHFKEGEVWVFSPARAYCISVRSTNKVDLKKVRSVRCDDRKGEGFQSMLNIIG